mgnify:CR=1 FL=1
MTACPKPKPRICDGPHGCHPLITGRVLVPLGTVAQRERTDTVVYQRRES